MTGKQPKKGRGGRRPGAGRPKGARDSKYIEIAERAAKEGITPIQYMLQVLRDEDNDLSVRMDAAKSAAPYIHPRLSSVEANLDTNMRIDGIDIKFINAPES